MTSLLKKANLPELGVGTMLVTFIEVPCFYVFAYNKFKGHTYPDSFKDQDKEICRQVEQLNFSKREINWSITQRTLHFNYDIEGRCKDTNIR